MINRARQNLGVLRIYMRESLVYPANWLIWILTDAVNCFAMPLVFIAAAGGRSLAGYSTGEFFAYYVTILLVGSFVTSHFMWELNWEIKEGNFSVYLVRPISLFRYTFFRNLSWRFMRVGMAIPVAVLFLWVYRDSVSLNEWRLGPEFWVSLVLGHCLSFTFVMAFAMLALFLENAESVFELYYVPMLFLSGQLFPVDLYPDWALALARATPFYYTTGLPTELALGRYAGAEAWRFIAIQAAWVVGSYMVHRILWKRGTKQYAGVGI